MAKIKLQFSAWQELAESLDQLEGDLKATTEEALKASHAAITPKIEAAFQPHSVRFSGDTLESLRKQQKVEWSGLVGSIPIGFDISKGGLPSIFIMYGAPTVAPDKNVYNAFYGAATKREISKIQHEVFQNAINEAMK